jgi:hypothetical protein
MTRILGSSVPLLWHRDVFGDAKMTATALLDRLPITTKSSRPATSPGASKTALIATRACPGGQTGSSRALLRLTRGVTPLRAGSSYSLSGQGCSDAAEGSRLDADIGCAPEGGRV